MIRSSFARAAKLTGASACALLAFAVPASAATITVNTTNDENNADGDCSLREATIAANEDTTASGCTAGSGADTINVPAGTYVLTIENVQPSGVFDPADEDSSRTGDLDILGQATLAGAGARTVTIDANGIDRAIETDEVITEGNGGPSTSTTIFGVTITGGEVDGRGGGIEANQSLILRESTVDSNTAGSAGGGVHVGGNSARIVRSTLSNNAVTSGEGDGGGGGLHNNVNDLLVENSTISGNSAIEGGGIADHGGALRLTSSTVVNNTASFAGGGIQGVDPTGNDGESSAVDTAENSIVANNRFTGGGEPTPTGLGGGRNCAPGDEFDSQGHNLSNTDECGFEAPTDQPSTPAGVRPLANNGGPTNTHALSRESAAVDQGAADQATDQRRVTRPQNGDNEGAAIDDIGAFELAAPVTAANNSYSTREDTRLDVPPPGVLGNDSGGLGTLAAELVDGPDHGTLTLRSNGSFTYTPDRNYNGPDSFTYRACDDSTPRQCDTATVSIRVTPVDDGGGTGGEEQEPCTITGTDDNDILRGTPGADVICGGDGNDIVYGGGGNDIIRGGAGNDVLRGDDGDDRINGGSGSDDIVGGEGDDRLVGGSGADDLTGQGGNDSLDASDGVRGNDVANGGPGSDTCSRDPGDDETSC